MIIINATTLNKKYIVIDQVQDGLKDLKTNNDEQRIIINHIGDNQGVFMSILKALISMIRFSVSLFWRNTPEPQQINQKEEKKIINFKGETELYNSILNVYLSQNLQEKSNQNMNKQQQNIDLFSLFGDKYKKIAEDQKQENFEQSLILQNYIQK